MHRLKDEHDWVVAHIEETDRDFIREEECTVCKERRKRPDYSSMIFGGGGGAIGTDSGSGGGGGAGSLDITFTAPFKIGEKFSVVYDES